MGNHIILLLSLIGEVFLVVTSGSYVCANIAVLEKPTRTLRKHLHLWERPDPRWSELRTAGFAVLLAAGCIELGFSLAHLLLAVSSA